MTKVTAKYQVTIPREVRSALNIMPGVEVTFQKKENRFYIIKDKNYDPIEKWRGSCKEKKTPDMIMNELRGYDIEDID